MGIMDKTVAELMGMKRSERQRKLRKLPFLVRTDIMRRMLHHYNSEVLRCAM